MLEANSARVILAIVALILLGLVLYFTVDYLGGSTSWFDWWSWDLTKSTSARI